MTQIREKIHAKAIVNVSREERPPSIPSSIPFPYGEGGALA